MSNPEPPDNLKRLYASTGRDEPSASLDAAILARARGELAAAAAAPAPAALTRRRAWGPPLALAAVLVLSVSVSQMQRENPEVLAVAPPAQTIALAPEPASKPDDAAASAARDSARSAPARERQPPAPGALSRQTLDERASPAAAPPEFRADAVPRASPDTAGAAGAAASRAERNAVEPFPAAAPPAARPIAPPVAAAAAPEADASQSAASSDSAGSMSPGAAAPGRMQRAPQAARKDETPEAWLARLAELKKQGRLREFNDGLAEFRKRHPAYAIPESIAPPK